MKNGILHVADVGSGRVRFVQSPVSLSDAPWVVAPDVLSALGVPSDGLDVLLRSIRHAAPVIMADVGGDALPIVPPWVLVIAAGVIRGSAERGLAIRAMKDAHHRACPTMTAAMRALALIRAPSAMP